MLRRFILSAFLLLASCAQPVFAQSCQPVAEPEQFVSQGVEAVKEVGGLVLLGEKAAAFGSDLHFEQPVEVLAAFVVPHDDDLILVLVFRTNDGTTVACVGEANDAIKSVIKKHFGVRGLI